MKDKELETEVMNWIILFPRDFEEDEGQNPRIIVWEKNPREKKTSEQKI